jgi:hypothetical protein
MKSNALCTTFKNKKKSILFFFHFLLQKLLAVREVGALREK